MDIDYREARPADLDALVELLDRIPPSVVRLSNRYVYRRILRDSFAFDGLVCIAAFRDGSPIGYVLACRDWHRFKRGFLLRHPALAVMLIRKWITALGRDAPTSEPPDPPGRAESVESGPAWSDGGPENAKVIYVGVDASARGQGIGRELYRTLCQKLANLGVRRLDAHIEHDNHASVVMHRRSGWTVRGRSHGYFAFMELDKFHGENR